MAGGRKERHIDDEYLMTGTHKAATSTTLRDAKADFGSCGAMKGLYIANITQAGKIETSISLIDTVTEEEITTDDDVPWYNGDVYEIYKTASKNSPISSIWTDRSRGWKSDPKDLVDGWKPEDEDIDRNNPGRVFGPNQPKIG